MHLMSTQFPLSFLFSHAIIW